jgi:N-methylhydantoinase B
VALGDGTRLPGGGGYGDLRQRPRQLVQADLAAEYITKEQAVADYGLNNTDIA